MTRYDVKKKAIEKYREREEDSWRSKEYTGGPECSSPAEVNMIKAFSNMSLPTDSYSRSDNVRVCDTELRQLPLWEDNLEDEILLETHASHPMIMECNDLTVTTGSYKQEQESVDSYQLLVVMKYCLMLLMADREDYPYPVAVDRYGTRREECRELPRSRKRPREQGSFQDSDGSLSGLYEVF